MPVSLIGRKIESHSITTTPHSALEHRNKNAENPDNTKMLPSFISDKQNVDKTIYGVSTVLNNIRIVKVNTLLF